MEYFDILLNQDYKFFKEMMLFRDLECSYFTTETSFANNTIVICKSLYRNLINSDNIKNTLYKLTTQELATLTQIMHSNSLHDNISNNLKFSSFFLPNEDNKPVFHKNFKKEFEQMIASMPNQTNEKADAEAINAEFTAYSLYVIIINSIMMGKVRCLANSKPGIRMFECISQKTSNHITKDFFGHFFNFLTTSGLIHISENPCLLNASGELESRASFYTNYFKFIDSNITDPWFKNLKSSFKAKHSNIIYNKNVLDIDQKTFNLLVLSDFIKIIDKDKFVFTELATCFLTKQKVDKSDTKNSFYILPGFKLLLERTIDEKILSFIIKTACIEKFDIVFNIVFNIKSLIKAKKVGIDAEEIVTFLKQHCYDVPNDLVLMISDSHERYGEVKLFSKYNTLTTDDKHIKEKILNIDEILKYVVFSNDKTIILKKSKSPIDLKHLLIENGLIPEFKENSKYFEIKHEDILQVIEYLNIYKNSLKKNNSTLYDKIVNLLDKLKSKGNFIIPEKKPEFTQKTTKTKQVQTLLNVSTKNEMTLEDKMNILNFVIGKKYNLNISYKQKGTDIMEERLVVPKFLDGDFLIAYCKLRKGTRKFNIYTLLIKELVITN